MDIGQKKELCELLFLPSFLRQPAPEPPSIPANDSQSRNPSAGCLGVNFAGVARCECGRR